MFNLTHKVAVITGGGSGIGRSVSILLAKQGATVYVLDLNSENANAVVDEILNAGGKAEALICNVAEQQEVFEVFRSVGKVNILVNNAGIPHIGTLETTTEADFDKIVQVNIKGVYNCLFSAVPVMKANGGGVIINMSSIAAIVGISNRFAYSMSKGAVAAMTLSIARDYLQYNIRCNSVSPARVHTPFVDNFIAKNYPGKEQEMFETLSKSQPIGRMAAPEEIAGLVLYLCSDEASFITGTDYAIDGGFVKLNN